MALSDQFQYQNEFKTKSIEKKRITQEFILVQSMQDLHPIILRPLRTFTI